MKRDLIRRIKLDGNRAMVYSGSRENAKKHLVVKEDKKKFYVVIPGRIFDSVYNFRTNSVASTIEWATYILHIIKGLSNVDIKTVVTLVLGYRANIASARTLRFPSKTPIVSEALIKLKRIFETERGLPSKFGIPGRVDEINLLSGGRILEPIEELKNGDVIYVVRKDTSVNKRKKLGDTHEIYGGLSESINRAPKPPTQRTRKLSRELSLR